LPLTGCINVVKAVTRKMERVRRAFRFARLLRAAARAEDVLRSQWLAAFVTTPQLIDKA
jgi:hypothetical protein